MDQETMDAIRSVIVNGLREYGVDEALLAPDEGDAVYATINGEQIVLTITPV